MNAIEAQHLIDRCAQARVVSQREIYTSPATIARIINAAVAVVLREDIEILLSITKNLMNLPTSDDATLVTVGISEQLITIDQHLARWFLDILLRDADADLRSEMSAAFQLQSKLNSSRFASSI